MCDISSQNYHFACSLTYRKCEAFALGLAAMQNDTKMAIYGEPKNSPFPSANVKCKPEGLAYHASAYVDLPSESCDFIAGIRSASRLVFTLFWLSANVLTALRTVITLTQAKMYQIKGMPYTASVLGLPKLKEGLGRPKTYKYCSSCMMCMILTAHNGGFTATIMGLRIKPIIPDELPCFDLTQISMRI